MKLIRGGYASRHESSFFLSRPHGVNHYVILLLRSQGEFWLNGVHHLLSPGDAIIIAPNTSYSYHNPNGQYSDDWLHVELGENEILLDTLKCNVPFALDDFDVCSTYIQQILWEHAYTSPTYLDINIHALLLVLLNHLSVAYNAPDSIDSHNSYLHQLKLLRLQMENSPADEHSIRKHAADLCISTSHFQHLYAKLFGISFQADLIKMRISHAEILLQTTDLPMEYVAEACGYSTQVHFFRQFKQLKGITPAKYRKSKQA